MNKFDVRIRDLFLLTVIVALAVALALSNRRIARLERQETYRAFDPLVRFETAKNISEERITAASEFALILYSLTDPEPDIVAETDRSLRSVLGVTASSLDEPGFESQRWREMRLIQFWADQAMEFLESKKEPSVWPFST